MARTLGDYRTGDGRRNAARELLQRGVDGVVVLGVVDPPALLLLVDLTVAVGQAVVEVVAEAAEVAVQGDQGAAPQAAPTRGGAGSLRLLSVRAAKLICCRSR